MLLGTSGVNCAPAIPVANALAVARNSVGMMANMRDFVTGIRAAFGRAEEFVHSNGFNYKDVYNSQLQYDVIQAFEAAKTNQQLGSLIERISEIQGEGNKIFYSVLATALILIINIILAVIAGRSNRNDQNINVNQRL